MDTPMVFDAVVIGSGITGAVTAWRLAAGGARVIVLEAGEESPDRRELVGAFARALERTPGAPYAGRAGDRFSPDPETDRAYYEFADDRHFLSTYLRRVGGSTWHFLGNVPRFLPNDFKLRERYRQGVDWPLDYKDLEVDYCEAERLMGVSGDHEQWDGLFGAYRSRPFPMSKIWESYSDRCVAPTIESIEVLGAQLRVMSTPQARNARPYDGRPACAGNSSCVPICPIQAKYDATVHVAKAIAAGAELRPRSVVTRIEAPRGGCGVGRVHFKDWNNQCFAVDGRVVVLAAHAIESAKLLLLSGIANSSDQVGRNLMDHPQGSGVCLMPFPVFPLRGPPTTCGIDALRDGAFRSQHAAFRMSLGNDGWGRVETPAATVGRHIDAGLFGDRLKEAVRHDVTRQFRISFSTEMLPDCQNRVVLSTTEVDALGIPKPRLFFSLSDYTTTAFDRARSVIKLIFDALGATQSDPFHPKGTAFTGAGHIMGTCRMGPLSRSSVVDANCRSHDHPNLFIIGASVFPTCGTANPTLTALALALRACRAIKADLASGALAR